ncbi:uncharacterized protein PAC_19722 [Phialocephala subalpina]|uniref:Heterokaryon incompatibility domain-containing protein n=1 Tax=Phialocephala subalpina TaxID=576137 RepID=A0A1L7XXM7_9HELO|nr:uncharacterized protein PAC_19722 [Phialocephala subalpina]
MAFLETSLDDKSKWLNNTLERAQSHLTACLEGHERCRSQAATKLPTRVIDVGPADGSKHPFLYISNDQVEPNERTARSNAPAGPQGKADEHVRDQVETLQKSTSATQSETGEEFKYTTLSYCWGKSQNFITTLDNLKSMKEIIPWDKLPLTIQDAILITRGLGMRYIWVDALCIIQDSPSDWTAESAKMAEIYGGSFLTISAALGPDVHHGLMQDWTPNGIPRLPTPFALGKDPLYSRAWALQERMLSPRVLIFGSEELYWECYNSHTHGILFKKLSDKPSPSDWHTVIRDYTCRNLTDEKDKLPALTGLASVYGQATGKDYIYGLWKQTLIVDLLWSQRWLVVGNIAIIDPPESYRAPSWSWASVNGNCMYFIPNTDIKLRTKILATFPDSSQSGSETTTEGDEWLLLHGPLIRAEAKQGKIKFGSKGYAAVWMDLRDIDELDGIGRTTTSLETWNSNVSRADTWCLLLGYDNLQSYGLVLVEAVDFGEGNYRRVGTFIGFNWQDSFGSCGDSDLLLI